MEIESSDPAQPGSTQPEQAPTPEAYAQGIDHVMVECADPRMLFDRLTCELGLPAAWPVEDFAPLPFVSGGVTFGNVNLEMVRFSGQPPPLTGVKLTGLALEANAPLEELKTRVPPIPNLDELKSSPNWTDVAIHGVLDAPQKLFFVEYRFDVRGWRKALRDRLVHTHGGVLRIEGMDSLTVEWNGSSQPQPWMSLFGLPSMETHFRPKLGPSLLWRQGQSNRLGEIRLRSASLPEAREALRKLGALGTEEAGEIRIRPEYLGGLDIRIVGKA